MFYGARRRGARHRHMPKPPLLLAALLAVAIMTPPAVAADRGGVADRTGAAERGSVATESDGAYVPDEVVVRYARDADRRDRAAVQRAVGAGEPRVFAPRSRVLTIRDGDSVAETVRELQARPEVASAAPNAIARIGQFIPNDRGRARRAGGWQQIQWNFLPGAGVNAPLAWQHLFAAGKPGGRGTVVAVLDTGVAYADRGKFRRSSDFSAGDFVRGRDFVDGDRFPLDENGHGTHVAGTIGESTDNARGVTGLAYGARIMPVRVLDEYGAGDSAAIAGGIRWAVRHGADVINLSFEFDDRYRQVTAFEIPDVLGALRFAERHGVVVVAAAGNQKRDTVAYPARHESVIAVAATTEHGCKAKYSNTGQAVDIAAPGGGRDDRQDISCPRGVNPNGRDIFQTTYPWATRLDGRPPGAGFKRFALPTGFQGTSMAAPHVAAVAALVIASGILGPDPTPAQVTARLQATAIDVGAPGPDEAYGAGRLDASAATDPAIAVTSSG
jgi:serine protease